MPTVNKLPLQIVLTISPEELRKLADKMEVKIASCKLGESTLVEVWQTNDVEILIHFDIEKAEFIDLIPELFEPGMVLSHKNRAFEIIRTEYCKADKGYWVWVKGENEPLFCGQMTFYKVKRKL